jgi:hypothetical protein
MLHRIGNPCNSVNSISEYSIPSMPPIPTGYKRDEKEDMKTAIDALYEFKRKLNELHPVCVDLINSMLQQRF